ncbi:MAG: carboxypeptidase regulatory-like domain-containing protein, partial [Flavobacteriaceae bacterium]|nr:carboxypeptidase regulatory-like domain-containing protein [Flavobacteriaceae bacterium]
MNKIYFNLLLVISTFSFSQQPAGNYQQYANLTFTVTGSVTDSETEVPLEYATITLTSKRDSATVLGAITGEDGKFSLEAKPGMYNLKIDYISFESYIDDNFLVKGNTDIGNKALNLDVSMLDEVEVRAERTQVEVRLDKKIYNVGQDITVRGGNVSDVLANIPSIDVDFDGNISLRGN